MDMNLRKLLLANLFLLAAAFVFSQPAADTVFAAYAKKQNSLFVEAYEKRDVSRYETMLSTFLRRYDSLPAAQQKTLAPYLINAYYNLSCAYSLLGNKPAALRLLSKAVKSGYTNYDHLQEDSDLDAIRHDKAFQALVQPLRDLSDYLYILKKDNRFTTSDSMPLPAFTYQPATDSNLVHLRQAFRLDSIAGSGNEVSKLLNLLHWVHNTIPHDGQHESGIQAVNGYAIASVAQLKRIGVSCGELATVLNDCYLAMGWKSRKLYCFPKDSLQTDYDSHVINAVYSTQLKKWLWMDPTHDAYVMNEKGELLGIEEVRERLIHDQPLILNPDANWNHQASTTKEQYLYHYMAKNLYRFFCTLDSGFDVETPGGDKTVTYVNLFPTGYGRFRQRTFRMEYDNRALKTRYITYNIHNPASFWQAPD